MFTTRTTASEWLRYHLADIERSMRSVRRVPKVALTPEQRSLLASANADQSWANTTDRSKRTAPARDALRQKFLNECDGDPVRAESAWKSHFKRLAVKSAQARARRRELEELADKAGDAA